MNFDVCFAVKNKDGFILTPHSSDTIYQFSFENKLTPILIRKPSALDMSIPVLINGLLETERYSFFRTEKIEYDFKTKQGGETKSYLWDKETKEFYQVKTINRDYKEQKLILSPAGILSSPTEHSSNPQTGVIRLRSKELLEAYSKGFLSGKLKAIVESTSEEDLFVLMIMKFK